MSSILRRSASPAEAELEALLQRVERVVAAAEMDAELEADYMAGRRRRGQGVVRAAAVQNPRGGHRDTSGGSTTRTRGTHQTADDRRGREQGAAAQRRRRAQEEAERRRREAALRLTGLEQPTRNQVAQLISQAERNRDEAQRELDQAQRAGDSARAATLLQQRDGLVDHIRELRQLRLLLR